MPTSRIIICTAKVYGWPEYDFPGKSLCNIYKTFQRVVTQDSDGSVLGTSTSTLNPCSGFISVVSTGTNVNVLGYSPFGTPDSPTHAIDHHADGTTQNIILSDPHSIAADFAGMQAQLDAIPFDSIPALWAVFLDRIGDCTFERTERASTRSDIPQAAAYTSGAGGSPPSNRGMTLTLSKSQFNISNGICYGTVPLDCSGVEVPPAIGCVIVPTAAYTLVEWNPPGPNAHIRTAPPALACCP